MLGVAWLAAACDLGPRDSDPGRGPPLHVLDVSPANGAGTECDPGDDMCGVPLNTEIRVHVDRLLHPESAVRQAIRLFTGAPNNGGPFLEPSYDFLSQTLRFRLSGTLEPKVLYQVELPIPVKDTDFGLRAFDLAPLEAGAVPLRWSFRTAGAGVFMDTPPAPAAPSCNQVSDALHATCASSCCHGEGLSPMGLDLSSPSGLQQTALGRVAHETETGDTAGTPYANPARFGVAMPVIDPGSPLTSYLFYKLLLKPENLEPCTGSACPSSASFADGTSCEPLSVEERQRLREWFVKGEPMPLDRGVPSSVGCTDAPFPRQLDCGTLRFLVAFVESGQHCQ